MKKNNPYDRARRDLKNDGGRPAREKARLIRARDERNIERNHAEARVFPGFSEWAAVRHPEK